MTGFGRVQGRVGPRELTIELKTVNSRYLDLKLYLPGSLQGLEQILSDKIRKTLSRGRVDCQLTETFVSEDAAAVQVNWPLARKYFELLSQLAKELQIPTGVSLDLLVRQKDVIQPAQPPDPASLEKPLGALMEKALEALIASREREGSDLRRDVEERLSSIESHAGVVKNHKSESAAKLKERLMARLAELGGAPGLDEQRFAQEVAYLADRADVTEELVRLDSHILKLRELLKEGGPVGRKLDFLVQELNREANTVGSKAASAQVQHTVVEIKSEVERIREQVQNIE